jgi:hypothetical protein
VCDLAFIAADAMELNHQNESNEKENGKYERHHAAPRVSSRNVLL